MFLRSMQTSKVSRGKEKSQPLHPREDKRSLEDRPAYAFLQNCRQQTLEGLAGYFRDPGDRMGEILELTPTEFTPCAHGAEHEEDDSHKIGELPSTAICGNDITASCFYVVGELSKNAGVHRADEPAYINSEDVASHDGDEIDIDLLEEQCLHWAGSGIGPPAQAMGVDSVDDGSGQPPLESDDSWLQSQLFQEQQESQLI
eukprot:s2490_g11.t1